MLALQGLIVQWERETLKQISTTTKEAINQRYEPGPIGAQRTTKPGIRYVQGIKAGHGADMGGRTS